MKKLVFLSVFLLAMGVSLFSQDAFTYDSEHYSVRSFVSLEEAQATAERLEAYLGVYNNYFHFDLAALDQKLKVRIFAEKAKFDQYLQRLINETREDYVYLHYTDKARSELVGFVDVDKKAPEASIAHQAFIQFLRAYVPNPPLWLREGFAVYFEEIVYEPVAKKAELRENLAWLETLKSLVYGDKVAEALSLDQVLQAGVEEAKEKIQVFYPLAWGLVHYLAKTDSKEDNRVLWDSISLLDSENPLQENSAAILSAFKWTSPEAFQARYLSYYQGKKTYRELVQEGIELYAAGKAKEAEAAFTGALKLQDLSFIPYYYLGLINYDKAVYAEAETYYQKALDKGANPALTNYALGVNAFADNRFDSAKAYLQKTVELDPTFQEKSADLLQRMES